jgi:hypothetical protein
MFAKRALGLVGLYCCAAFAQPGPQAQFMSLEQARPVLTALHKSLPDKLKTPAELQPAAWQNWMQESDRDIHARLERGEEDTLVNLLRFGVTFTREYRIEDEYLVRYGQSSLANSLQRSARAIWCGNSRPLIPRKACYACASSSRRKAIRSKPRPNRRRRANICS